MYGSTCVPHLWSWTGPPSIRAITEVRKKNEIPYKQRSKKKSYFLQTMGELWDEESNKEKMLLQCKEMARGLCDMDRSRKMETRQKMSTACLA